jgi:hypothetical protein
MLRLGLTGKEKALFLAPALLLAVPVLYHFRGDALAKEQRKLAGARAIDCGTGHGKTVENNTTFEQSRSVVDECAVAAFTARKPFRARYDNRIVDGADGPEIESTGVVGTKQGQVYFFYYRCSAGWWKKQYDYQQAVCPKPVITTQSALGCGTCAGIGSELIGSCLWNR